MASKAITVGVGIPMIIVGALMAWGKPGESMAWGGRTSGADAVVAAVALASAKQGLLLQLCICIQRMIQPWGTDL